MTLLSTTKMIDVSLSMVSNVVLITTVVLILTLILPRLLNWMSLSSSSSCDGYVVPAITRHARFLPRPSAHTFVYSTLFLAVQLDSLEQSLLDHSTAFKWKGNHLEPEWQDESQLAQLSLTRPSTDMTSPSNLQDWKANMRRSERRERRMKQQRRRRNPISWLFPWSVLTLDPTCYLCTDFHGQPKKQKWLQGSILVKLAYQLRECGYLTIGPQDETGLEGVSSSQSSSSSSSSWVQQLGQVWTVTMPCLLGIGGINPLTVYYCFRPFQDSQQQGRPWKNSRVGPLWLVVLEVHNTFSERHVYVVQVGVQEDKDVRKGYDHQWTFQRTFHVSPFNDRGGYYRLALQEPFDQDGETKKGFQLGVHLLLLIDASTKEEEEEEKGEETKSKEENLGQESSLPPKIHESETSSEEKAKKKTAPQFQKKLMASLHSYPLDHSRKVRPMTTANLYAALLRQPYDLLLTFLRILYQATKLHFTKRLDAFARPDMVQVEENLEMLVEENPKYNGIGLPLSINRIEPHRKSKLPQSKRYTSSMGLVYSSQSWFESIAKQELVRFAQIRVNQLCQQDDVCWSFHVVHTDPSDPGLVITSTVSSCSLEPLSTHNQLILYTRSASIYLDLLVYAHPRLARLIGSINEKRWGCNDSSLYDRFFTILPPSSTLSISTNSFQTKLRKRYLTWQLSFINNHRHALQVLGKQNFLPILHPFENQNDCGWFHVVSLVLIAILVLSWLEERIFSMIGARYVESTEPWLELDRAVKDLDNDSDQHHPSSRSLWNTRLGSVRNDSI